MTRTSSTFSNLKVSHVLLTLALASSGTACRNWPDLPIEGTPTPGAGDASSGMDSGQVGTTGSGGMGGLGGVGATAGAAGIGGAPSSPGGVGGAMPIPTGGVGGPGSVSCDYPATSSNLSPWQTDETRRTLDEDLARIRAGMPGHWQGIVTTPWVPPYDVTLTFDADGGYSGRCHWSSNQCCRAFYYGTDDDSSLKQYALDTVSASGKVGGDIDIIFGDAQHGYYESGYEGALENVQLDATGDRVRFEFWYDGKYGPLTYDLQRATAP